MELKFKIDTDDLYGEDGVDFEFLLTDSLMREVVKNCKKDLASDRFKAFAKLASDTIISGTKLKMENFLSEEIVLTEGWGKKTFVGSVEDLMKKRFDDVILRRVDGNGNTLEGCANSEDTWIEWKIKEDLTKRLEKHIDTAKSVINCQLKEMVDQKLIAIKNDALKEKVDSAFTSILNNQDPKRS